MLQLQGQSIFPLKKKSLKEIFEEDSPTNQQKAILHKLSPLSIVRRSVPNSQDIRKRLVAKGYKYFSKFIASGNDTENILKRILKSKTIKYINSFEFDPYFCEVSCINTLTRMAKRLGETRSMNLIIRRVDKVNEITMLYSMLYKINRLERIRLEFSK